MTAESAADETCRAMGLARLADPALPPGALRLVLTPSFHPAVCATWVGDGGRARLEVIASAVRRGAELREVAGSHPPDKLAGLFADALAESQRPFGSVVLDGMGVAAYRAGEGGFASHSARSAVAALAAHAIWLGWHACRGPAVRAALGACGRYVGFDTPAITLPDTAPPARVLVLGDAAGRAEFFAGLRAARGAGGGAASS